MNLVLHQGLSLQALGLAFQSPNHSVPECNSNSRRGTCCAGLFGPSTEGACATTGSAAATAGSATATATAGSASPARLSLAWFGFVAWRFAGFRET